MQQAELCKVLQGVLNLAERWNTLARVPMHKESKASEQVMHFLIKSEKKYFIAAAEGRMKVMITLCLNTGPRIGEIRGCPYNVKKAIQTA